MEYFIYFITTFLIAFVLGYILKLYTSKHDSIPISKYNALLQEFDKKQKDFEFAKAKIEELTEENKTYKKDIDDIRTKINEYVTITSVLETQINNKNEQLEIDKKRIQILENQIEDQKVVIEKLKEENILLNAKFEGVKVSLESSVKELENFKIEVVSLNESNSKFREDIVNAETENKFLKEKLEQQKKEIEEIGKKFTNEFQLLADNILETKSKKFAEQNQINLKSILEPLGKKIEEFKTKVEETYDKESKQRFSLEEKVKELALLNQQINIEAQNLTQALKGSVKQQGNWGEMILESILQNSGLIKDREYKTQEFIRDDSGNTVKDEEGKKLQPDIIIYLPEGRQIIIDSKVSLIAYEKYNSSSDKQSQSVALNEHIKSIRAHIDNLSSKNYQNYLNSLDFVMLFVPIEPAYILAVQHDTVLWEYAYKKRILLISPTNLIAALKLVSDLWQREQQNRNAIQIAERGAKLYDKFVGFVESLQDIGKNLERSQKSYDSAMKQLSEGSGNLIGQVEKIKKLGLSTQKSISSDLKHASIADDEGEQ